MTAIIINFEPFKNIYMPFRLKNVAATFQVLMDKIFANEDYLCIEMKMKKKNTPIQMM